MGRKLIAAVFAGLLLAAPAGAAPAPPPAEVMVQVAKPGDRIVVFFGYGHAFLLRQCVTETPGLKLVEPNGYLPG